MQREAVQAIDEKLLKMGKLDLIKGQPAYLADKSKKRKKPHEPDQGENVTEHAGKVKKPRKPRKPRNITTMQVDPSQPWKALNRQSFAYPLTSTIQTVPTYLPANYTAMASGSNGLGAMVSMIPPRIPMEVKISTPYTFIPAEDSACLLCGGPKHRLRDCPAPKGGIEK